MDSEKIKILRNKITIPLDVTIQLLKKNNGDIDISEQEFHNNNIREISISAECDPDTARENYELCQYDITKAIERINSRQIIITTRDAPSPRNEIGYILWPEDQDGECYKTTKRNDAFIPTTDFDYVIDEFKSVFPLENPWNKEMEVSFDICGHNYFDKTTCKIIIDRIMQTKTDELKVAKFKNELIEWLDDKLEYAEYIVVYGNL
ncbi:hypothetical protein [Chryseobacterium sp. BIGb0232]|uniref:hypothetical protein n=1 Tax=Chryseobacterium sp. BIGb0232 TaxID=2940598 RepID=UPI000F4636A2|nr:hypothetical protein [Chryseobacterium sp. BIGb0232]MCS4303297.1 hypothetical protein [Chryseobacterium sp. BIGb0232]ROS11429.1 hypothetical protein EDF65_3841 [Chryseobacterium nakagawai]